MRKIIRKRPGATDSVTYGYLQAKLAILDLVSLQVHKEMQLGAGPVAYIKLSDDDKNLGYGTCISRISLEDGLILKPKIILSASGGIDFLPSSKRVIGIRHLGLSKDYITVFKASLFSFPLPTTSNWTDRPLVRFARRRSDDNDPLMGSNHSFAISNDRRRLAVGDKNGGKSQNRSIIHVGGRCSNLDVYDSAGGCTRGHR